MSRDASSSDDLLHCQNCDDELGETTLVYVDGDDEPLCDDCADTADVAGVGYVKQWYDQPMFGDLTRQALGAVKPIPDIDVVTDGGSTVADAERTIIDTLLAHGRCGLGEIALAAAVDRSYSETTAALGTLEAAGIVEQVGDDTPQWRVVAEKEVAACE